MWAEEWSYGESLYFYIITFSTVGFGDLLPTNKYVTVPFIFLGLTAVSNILHAAASMALVKRVTVGSTGEQREENEAKFLRNGFEVDTAFCSSMTCDIWTVPLKLSDLQKYKSIFRNEF
ncbi:TWiK family of potassium channels protein 18 [Acropora cervicornis]|uniref:TWiK family of potassium channels protein 18 n=1 Tax=Acropora cervicornis TaxID=6130 RepID=A0AAD9V850_ACRCE|nr:TWiK family of potassium channels protein 18 [Acropora cervicornis]